MNAQQIIQNAIPNTYNSGDLENVKSQMVTLLDGMAQAIAPAKAKGIPTSELRAQADGVIRSKMRKLLGDNSFYVTRDGKPAIISISAETVNQISDAFGRNI
jgi:hypothetical protein